MKYLLLFTFVFGTFITHTGLGQNNRFITSRKLLIKDLAKQPASIGKDTSILRYELDIANEYVNVKMIDSAHYWINSAHKKVKALDWKPGWGYFYRTRGYYYTFAAKKDSSVSDYIQAVQIWESLSRWREAGIAGARLGAMLAADYQFDKAFHYLNNSLNIFQKSKDYFSQANVHNYLADVHRMMKNYPKSLEEYQKTVELAQKYKLPPAVIQTANVGTMYLFNNLSDSATIYYKKVGIDPIHDPSSIKDNYLANRLAEFYLEKNIPVKAVTYANVALDLAKKGKSDLLIKKGHELLSSSYKALGKSDLALKHFETVIHLTDSLQGIETSKRVNELELQFQTQKKEAEIARQKALLTANQLTILRNTSNLQLLNKNLELNRQKLVAEATDKKLKEIEFRTVSEKQKVSIDRLTLENQLKQQQQTRIWLIAGFAMLLLLSGFVLWNNRQLRQKNLEITQALLQGQTTERKRVAADLHDNLGSTLSSLRWSLNAIDKNKLSIQEQEVYDHVQNSIEQSYDQVRLLSHNLLPKELEKQGLWVTLEQLVRKLNKNTPVKFSLQLPDNQKHLDAKTEFELYSICLELTNNILKHAQATEAAITFEMENQVLRLTIRDNGKGISEKSSSGKGLRNISERVESLKGNWETVSNEMQGIKNVFTLPLGKLTKQAHA